MDDTQATYAAVILYYRLGARVFDTIDALRKQDLRAGEIVVVDNGSEDGVLDNVEERFPDVTVLRLPSNLGYSGAMNAAAAQLTARFDNLLFLTHETALAPDCISQLTAALRDDPELGLVGPALRLLDTDETWSIGGWTTRLGEVVHNHDEAQGNEIDWLDGACLFLRTSTFLDIGGFDEDYFLYWEDVAISLAVRKVARIACVPTAIAYQGTATAPIYFRTRNQVLLWRKQRDLVRLVGSIVKALAKVVVKDLGGRQPTQAKARLLGVRDGLTGRLSTAPIRMLREKKA